jgi:2-aminoadipate transaminase
VSDQDSPNHPAKLRLPAGRQLLALALDRSASAEPLYRQIREAVRAALLTGELGPGLRLPPEREMAAALQVNRTTVARAYQELVADGLAVARGSGGTVVMPHEEAGERAPGPPPWLLTLPALGEASLGPDPTLLRDVSALGGRPDVISFAAGTPGLDLVPMDALRACLDDALGRWGAAAFAYGALEGFGPLREILRERLGAGLVGPQDGVLVVSGATQGLALAARTLIEPGDEVVVEAPTYAGTLQTFLGAGARPIGIPVDGQGLRTELLEGVLARRRVRLIVVQPTCHNPTGASLSARRREHLLFLARRHAVPILEDDPHGAFCYDREPPGPLKLSDRHGSVVYLGGFSKTVAPGLRVAWMVAPEPVLARLAFAKQFSDLNTNAAGQLMLAELVDSGAYDRHVRASRDAYRERRDALLAALAAVSGRLEAPAPPSGGFYLWCRLPGGPHARLLAALAAREGVAIVAGEAFYAGSVRRETGADRVRLCFTSCTPDVAAEGVRRLARALEHVPAASGDRPAADTPVVV